MHVTLIHNPSAGDEDHSRGALLETVEGEGHAADWHSTDEDGWEAALDAPTDLVVVVGGDGTVRRVFVRAAGTRALVTLLPLGSANNIARSLGVGEADIPTLVRGWERGERRPYRLGRFASDAWQDRFVESVGGGLFAAVLARDEQRGGDASGEDSISLGLELLRDTVARAPALPWEVEVDGDDASGDLLAVEVMNIGITGPRVPLAPEADPGDERLDVVLVGEPERAALARYLDARLDGRDVEVPRLPVLRAERVVLKPPDNATLRLDDEILDRRRRRSWSGGAHVTVDAAQQILVPR